jgi:hypothetical protein
MLMLWQAAGIMLPIPLIVPKSYRERNAAAAAAVR